MNNNIIYVDFVAKKRISNKEEKPVDVDKMIKNLDDEYDRQIEELFGNDIDNLEGNTL